LRLPPTRVQDQRVDSPLGEIPASLTVLDREQIEASTAITLDDLLSELPGFSLFRRQSSLAGHPTTQGVSLRGIGPSGASRALVLLDGIPLNDPFGGWVYWSKVPQVSIERVEVLRGGGSSLWGSGALGGVIHITSTQPRRNLRRFVIEGGAPGSLRVEGLASRAGENDGLVVEGRAFLSEGYFLLDPSDRGTIDQRADSDHGLLGVRYERSLTSDTRLLLGSRVFREERGNGTALTGNETEEFMARVGLRNAVASGRSISFDAFVRGQSFESTFSSQAPDRSAEAPALDQFDVPSLEVGASALASLPAGKRLQSTFGADISWAQGETNENFFLGDEGFRRERKASADRLLAGLWTQQLVALSSQWSLVAALRADYWRSFQGSRSVKDLQAGAAIEDAKFDDRDKVLLSPKLGVAWDSGGGLVLRSAVYRGFRAPTINELVRPFRVRNEATAANENLRPETLWGTEVGGSWTNGVLDTSLTAFYNELEDPVFNVAVGEGPGNVGLCGFLPSGGVCRQRLNLGEAEIRGAELGLGVHVSESMDLRVDYLVTDAELSSTSVAPQLEGRNLPQVPQHQVSLGMGWQASNALALSARCSWSDDRFEDPENTIELGDYAVVDVKARWDLGGGWSFDLSAANLFDRNYEVAETSNGLSTLGAPLLMRAGISFDGDAAGVPTY
jgi:vitamin B12 transporter